ncbi:MAG: MarR family transcriptional regulator [Asticcacaulis sp.]
MTKINTSTNSHLARDPNLADGGRGGDRLHRDLSTAVITFHEAVSRRVGMTAAERKTLGILGEMTVATPGQLAQATGLTTGAITGIVDRLEKAGYARRVPNPDDRRSVLIHALQQEKLAAELGPIFGSLSAAMAELSARYSADELALIHRYLAETTGVLRNETQKLKG